MRLPITMPTKLTWGYRLYFPSLIASCRTHPHIGFHLSSIRFSHQSNNL
ncbi:hypothetical protein VPHD51_0063 [Vibrio phage D51]